ncbi:PIN domain-containing protein [Candidatus Gottesmanbacteria bacterium]|nr:PIN domain-containing protein [Candidatus Gottesmanbacteria bacterium]
MKVYFADTNIFLRFILPENTRQKSQAEKYFIGARKKEIVIVVCQIVIFEICFALEKYYELPRLEVYHHLKTLVSVPYFEVEERENLLEALDIYQLENIDLVDAFLFCQAVSRNAEILSFDKDFKKLTSSL